MPDVQQSPVASYTLGDLSEGFSYTFEASITDRTLDAFADLSGDVSPLHVDAAFARERGFDKRVAHGAILAALVSRMVGVHLPGRNALIQSLRLDFRQPTYAGDTVRVTGTVDQLSESTRTMVLKVTISNVHRDAVHATGKVQIGLTAG